MEEKILPNPPISMTQRCEDFFRLFEEKPTIFKYENLITDLIANKENAILILYDDLVIFDPLLAELLRKDPVRIIEHFTKALKNILMFRGEHQASKDDYFIYIDSNDQDGSIFVPLEDISSRRLSQFIQSYGKVQEVREKQFRMSMGVFECLSCGSKIEIPQSTSLVKRPFFCPNRKCNAKRKESFLSLKEIFHLRPDLSSYYDYQMIKLQSSFNHNLKVMATLKNALVGECDAGDRILFTGIVTADYFYGKSGMNVNLFNPVIEINYFRKKKNI